MDLRKTYALTDAMETKIPEQVELQTALIAVRAWQACPNCVNFDPATQTCKPYAAVPPPNVVIHGCVQWDGLPF